MKLAHRSIALVATLAAVVALGCSDSPTGPATDRNVLTLGDSVQGTVAPKDSVVYHVSLQLGQTLAVHLWAADAPLSASLIDSTGGAYLTSVARNAGGPFASWSPFVVPRSGTYWIVVKGSSQAAEGFALRLAKLGTATERVSSTIQFGDTVSGESIDASDDIDDFVLPATAGQRIEIFFQTLAASDGQPWAELYSAEADGSLRSRVRVVPPASVGEDLERRGSGPIGTTSGVAYHILVHNASVASSGRNTVAYRLLVYAVDPRPETAPAAITPGDTIVESIDHVGDVDTFTLAAAAGTQFNLFAESDGAAPHAITATVYADDSATVGAHATVTTTLGAPLVDQASGRFAMPASGTVRVVVSDAGSSDGLYRGPYRLLVYPIDSLPEGRGASFAPGSTPVSGAIDMLGDVDVYDFTLDSTRQLAIRTDWPSDYSTTLQYQVYGANGAPADFSSAPPGTYHVRVTSVGTGQTGSYRGRYSFAIAPILPQPEHAPAVLVTNDTVRTETIAWPVDVDTFHFAPPGGDTVVFELLRPPGDSSWGRNLTLADASTGAPIGITSLWVGDRYQLPRVVVAPGATARATIYGSTERWAPGTEGAYQLVARRVSAAPEHRSPDIAVDDTVRDSLDYYGDIDDYVLHGTPGQNVEMQASWPAGYSPLPYTIAVFDPSTDSLFSDMQSWASRYSIATRIPAGGELRVRVCVGQGCTVTQCQGWDCTVPPHPLGPYWFIAHAVDPSPETRPAAFALGDTVSESIETTRDVDEYTFSGAAGDRVNVAFRWLQPSPETWAPGLSLELIDVASETAIATLVSDSKTAPLGDASTTVTLPGTGTYVVRVHSRRDPASGEADTGDYRFVVTAAP